MSKKSESSHVKISKIQANDLAVVISRMQNNADQVEKNILQTEDLLAEDTERKEKNQSLIHQKVNADNLAQAEGLLKDLFMDVDKAKKLQHPQVQEIEKDVRNLHDRWAKDCAIHRELYNQMPNLDTTQKIDWGPLLDEKQKHLNAEAYGPKLVDVEKQIAEHNILHQAIESYSTQLQPSTTTSKEQYAALKEKFSKLCESSQQRRNNLASLYEYMQSCNKELVYLSGQQERILHRDWSDRMVDSAGIRMEYEKFKNNALLAHEREVNKLQQEGDRLLELRHPGSSTIKTHRDAVQTEWQSFLNLCLAQEVHLDNIEDYKKFHLEADMLSESLERLGENLDQKFLANKSNHEVLLTLEGDEPAIRRNEQHLASLRELSSNVVPLKLRRTQPTNPTTAVSLCDWTDEEGTVRRGETLNLKSNYDHKNWEFQTSRGKTRTLPGACFMVPPPDVDALERVNSLDRTLRDLKSRRSALMTSYKTRTVEVVRPQRTVTVQSAPEHHRATYLASELDKIISSLDVAEKQILSRLRAPLDNRNPTGDLGNRLQEHERSALTVSKLESEKSAVQRELEPILAKKPLGPITSTLPPKLNTANNKIDYLNTLIDLYKKKATASMFLEKQMHKVDGIVSVFEEELTKDGVILYQPHALQSRSQQLQVMRKDAASKKDELIKLGRDLDLTQQACSPLQQGFKEYCPDIRRQENEVKKLKNRFTTVNNQLQDRSALIKDITNKNQDFQSAVHSLDFFLVNLPNNGIKPTDGVTQITAKQNAQSRVLEDIRRKSNDLDRVKSLSRDLQRVLNEYEIKSKIYHGTLNYDDDDDEDDCDDLLLKRRQTTMAQAVQTKEKNLLNLYSEVSAENNLLYSQLGTVKHIMARNEERVNMVVVNQQLQLQSQRRDLEESNSLKLEINEEVARRLHAEKDLESYRKRYVSLKNRRGVERVEEKEVVQYYRDPKLEVELQSLKNRIQDETVKRSRIHSDIEIFNEKITKLSLQLTKTEPKLVTKILTEYERDAQLDREAAKIREEIERIRLVLQTRSTETVQVRTELTVLAQQKPKIRERVVKKEVVRFEKDPDMLKAVIAFKSDIAKEEYQCKSINEAIFSTRSQINTLERVIPTIQPKIVTKVVKQVQQDAETLEESKKLHIALKEERDEIAVLRRDLSTLQLRYGELDKLRPKFEIKEIIKEIFRVDPETEVELLRLRKELQESHRYRTELEKEMTTVVTTLTTVRTQKPKVEYKEVTREVIKEEKSPEVIRELQKLNNQVSRLQLNYDTTLELLIRLRKERDELKVEKSKVEVRLVTKELIKYENDPLLAKELDRLQRNMREEIHLRRTVEEHLFDLRNQYIVLERQKPEERIVIQEVVHLQKDPKQILEHEKLTKNLDEETRARRQLELDIRQLRTLVQEKETTLAKMDDRHLKIQVEYELRQIKSHIYEFEHNPVPIEEKIVIEEVLRVERDPMLEKLSDGIRAELETECTNISRLEREIRNLTVKLEVLQKEKSVERVVYREVVRVEKDPAVEAEREHLRELVTQERHLRRDLEENTQDMAIKITHVQKSKSVTSQEEHTLITHREALQRERDDLLRELKMLETQRQSITITFQQQSKLLSERNQMAWQKSLKTSSEVERLEKEILIEKESIHQKEALIIELQSKITKEEHTETHTRETNLSTKISIMDPETGKDMSPYEAYMQGLIDRNHYIRLSELECDWEEITSAGPDGDTTILQDRKSGKQYSVNDALRAGRLTQYDVTRYRNGKMSISEFALLVVGETKKPEIPLITPRSPTKPSTPTSPLNSMHTSLRSSYTNLNTHLSSSSTNLNTHLSSSSTNLNTHLSSSLTNLNSHHSGSLTNLNSHYSGSLTSLNASLGDENFPISGIYDTTTESRMSVRSALTRKLIDTDTALRLLEAQAACGGIVDLNKKDKMSVHKAAEHGLIDPSHKYKLLNAQKAFTGVEDPVTKERLAVGLAARKGYMPIENAKRYMEAQYLTGGLVNPSKAGRVSIHQALASDVIDNTIANHLQDESSHTKELVDPISKERISYKQAMDRCNRDISTGLLLLPATSTDASNAPSYSNYRFNSPYGKY